MRSEKKLHDSFPTDQTFEHRLLFLSCRLTLDESEVKVIKETINNVSDWKRVADLSGRLGIAALVYRLLNRIDAGKLLPEEIFQKLGRSFRRHSFQNLKRFADLARILEKCNAANIPVIPLKGTYLASYIYEDIGLRPMGDIDILCRKQDCLRMVNILRESGYTTGNCRKQFPEASNGFPIKHLPPFFDTDGNIVELHLHIFPDVSHAMEYMTDVWLSANRKTLDGNEIHVLCTEYQILYLCLHLYQHLVIAQGEVRLFWFADIREFIIRNRENIDWKKLFRIGAKIGVTYRIDYIFAILAHQFHTPFPESVQHYYEKNPVYLRVSDLFVSPEKSRRFYLGLFKKIQNIEGFKNRLVFFTDITFPSLIRLKFRYRLDETTPAVKCYGIHLFHILVRFIQRNRPVKNRLKRNQNR